MSQQRKMLYILLVVQFVALILYPPDFFNPAVSPNAGQAIVLPLAMILLYVLALVGMNTGVLTPELGRTSLDFIQGINIVGRLMMIFPNLMLGGKFNWLFVISQLLAIALSWFAMVQNAKLRPNELLLKSK